MGMVEEVVETKIPPPEKKPVEKTNQSGIEVMGLDEESDEEDKTEKIHSKKPDIDGKKYKKMFEEKVKEYNSRESNIEALLVDCQRMVESSKNENDQLKVEITKLKEDTLSKGMHEYVEVEKLKEELKTKDELISKSEEINKKRTETLIQQDKVLERTKTANTENKELKNRLKEKEVA